MKECAHANVNRMSYADEANAVCLDCGQHWWRGIEYTRKEWNALMDDVLLQEIAATAATRCGVSE